MIPPEPSPPSFDAEGNLLSWDHGGHEWVETRPIRQNAPALFRGIVIWIKSAAPARAGEDLLHAVEWEHATTVAHEAPGEKTFLRRGAGWSLRLTWRWSPGRLRLSTELANEAGERWRQVEISYWAPAEAGGTLEMEGWSYEMPPYGRIRSGMLERGAPLAFTALDGRHLVLRTQCADSRTHFYHRGFCLKMGTASPAAAPGGQATLEIEVAATVEAPARPAIVPPPAPFAPGGTPRRHRLGLMLHLQYTPLPEVERLLERWVALSARLGFDYILLELDRGLAAHPAAPAHALGLERFAQLAAFARRHGTALYPMFNLLGHQWETGLLEWQPSWQESAFSAVCPSHGEVRAYASGLIADLAQAFGSPWVHIGGDELKLPGDGKDALTCPRCGPSPNLSAVVDYWNHLQTKAPSGVSLALWADQLLPPDAIAPGLRGHNFDGKGREHLARLDRRVRLFDWQYGETSPASSLHFLQSEGHPTAITSACGETLRNPFIHAQACFAGAAPEALHATWASPDPRDLPLEGVAAAALAHSGHLYDPAHTPHLCARLAARMLEELRP